MTGKADAVRAVSQQFKDRTNAVIEGVMAHLRDDNAKEILGPGLSPLIGRGSLKSIVTFALYADVLRMVRDMVMADGEISDEEVQESLGLLSVLAEGFAKVRKDYAPFTGLTAETALAFLDKYSTDAGLFGHANDDTKWAGAELCRKIQMDVGDSRPLDAFRAIMTEWATAIAASDSMTVSEQSMLDAIHNSLSSRGSRDAADDESAMHAGRILSKELAEQYAAALGLISEDPDAKERALSELNSTLSEFTDLSEEAARVLAGLDCDLSLDGVKQLSVEVAQALKPHRGSLSLDGLEDLAVDAANSLSQHLGELEIYAENFYENSEVFTALRKHPSLAVEPMNDPRMVAILGRKKFNANGDGFADATSIYREDECGADFVDCFRLIRTANGRPIWQIASEDLPERGASFNSEIAGTTYYFIGSREAVRARLESLPDRVITEKVVRRHLEDENGNFDSFGAISDSAAKILGAECDWAQVGELCLNGLASLSTHAAEGLSQPKQADLVAESVPVLQLEGLNALPDDVAEALGRRQWYLRVGALSLTAKAAAALSGIHSLAIVGLPEMSLDVANELGRPESFRGDRVAWDDFYQNGAGLTLIGTRLTPPVALSLARVGGILFLEDLPHLDAATAAALATRTGELRLINPPRLTIEVARELAAHRGQLVLEGTIQISSEALDELNRHHALTLPQSVKVA